MADSGSRDSMPPISAEEETLKRNTDCVYFLASPLTCKKGNECEYRHSEGARMNPRDCWYWLNGNCLNPKCLFRHPPLDSLIGTPGPTSTGASVLLQQTAPLTQTHAAAQTTSVSFNSSKQTVPCFYFQKGHCLKGDKCPFLHGPNSLGNLVTPPPPSTLNVASLAEPPQSLAKSNVTLQRCNSQQKIALPNPVKSVEVQPPAIKPANKAEIPPKDGLLYKKNMSLIPLDNNRFVLKPVSAAMNYENAGGIPHNRPFQHLEDPCQNIKEADEFLRESSPGFDVLVDDELESSEYYRNVDESGRNPVHGGRRHEFNFHLDHDSVAEFEGEPFNDFDDSDQYARGHKELGWGRSHRTSSERTLERSSIYSKERRGVLRPGIPDQIDRSDLRYRLSKQRRVNGSRPSTSPDRHSEFHRRDERYIEDHRRGSHSHRESRHPPREISISSRLQGRLKLPERPLPDNTDDFSADRENERGRSWGRLSPSRPLSLYQGKHHHDRIKRTQEFSIEGSNSRGPLIGRNEVVDTPNFAGPKRLAELKGVKISDPVEEQSSKSSSSTMKLGKVVGHQEPEDSLSFEGPKPLSVILKRKREVTSGDGAESSSKEESSRRQRVDVRLPVESENVVETENGDEGLLTTKGEESEHVVDDEMLRETMEEEDLEDEAQDQQEGEVDYEYETTDGVDFKTEDENVDQEDENVEPEEEYLDDEDGDDDDDDDFARKIGVMMS